MSERERKVRAAEILFCKTCFHYDLMHALVDLQ